MTKPRAAGILFGVGDEVAWIDSHRPSGLSILLGHTSEPCLTPGVSMWDGKHCQERPRKYLHQQKLETSGTWVVFVTQSQSLSLGREKSKKN